MSGKWKVDDGGGRKRRSVVENMCTCLFRGSRCKYLLVCWFARFASLPDFARHAGLHVVLFYYKYYYYCLKTFTNNKYDANEDDDDEDEEEDGDDEYDGP